MTTRSLKRRMKNRARKLGIAIPRGFRVTASWGRPATLLAAKLQRHYGLTPSGQPTWSLKWKLMHLNERIVYVARRELGAVETSPNWSPRIKQYLAAAGISFPTAWCAAFVTYVVHQAGYRGTLPTQKAWVPAWAQWARAKGYTVSALNARKGDLVCINWRGTDPTPDHIAIVVKNLGVAKQLVTVGGNEGDPGMVRKAWRVFSLAHTIIRLPEA